MTLSDKPRLIAFYLPQYHPIPENDAWWGKGFTEWTNVASAKPLFRGHEQPLLPADLGFYDLRVPEVRQAQADMAKMYGIEGFCYWHYWFGGKELLDRPFKEVLSSGEPDFPFCLAWANQSWTGIWHGDPDRVLIEQTYPGMEDHKAHFYTLLPAFKDPRYLQVDGKPLFFVFQPSDLDQDTINLWRDLAIKNGLNDLFMVGIIKNSSEGQHIKGLGFDACTISRTSGRSQNLPWVQKQFAQAFGLRKGIQLYQKWFKKPFHVYNHRDMAAFIDVEPDLELPFFPCVLPNWDNSPRSGVNGQVYTHTDPLIFEEHIKQAIQRVASLPNSQQIILIKSWNEWAEGNHLEPDQRFGHSFLEAVRNALSE